MMKQTVGVAESPDGTLTYLVEGLPEALPAVRPRDLEAAWGLAGEAARQRMWGERRAFRFWGDDGRTTELVISDRDARCWVGAADKAIPIDGHYGLSICLRLLALVDLLGRAEWATKLVGCRGGRIDLDPALVSVASYMRLGEDARFDERAFVARLPATSGPGSALSGA